MTRLAALALSLAGCSGSPEYASAPVPPSAWGGVRAPVLCPSADVAPDDLAFASEVWGATVDCGDPEATPVGVRELPDDLLGQAWLDRSPAEVWLDPRAWSYAPGVTVAHEIGHVLGFDHASESAGPCALMAPELATACPGFAVAGREFRSPARR